jgi:hypothetical protein
MSSNGNGIGNGKAAKKRRRRLILGSIAALILVGGGYGVYAALRPNHEIDPSKLAGVERGDLARVVVATGKIQPLSKIEVKSKASGIVKKLYVDYGNHVKPTIRLRKPRAIPQPPPWSATKSTRKVRTCPISSSAWNAPNRCSRTA